MSLKALSMTYSSRVRNAKAAIHDGHLVLHVGCGDGYLDPYLCTRFSSAVGVDINFLELQGAASANAGERAEYVLIDGLVLPFVSEAFDEIVSIDVLEHAEDDVALVHEMSRVLRPGGLVTITVPNANFPLTFDPVNYLLGLAARRHLPFGMWGFGHRRLYKVESLSQLLELLLDLCDNVQGNTVCPLGDACAMPVRAFVVKFWSEFKDHIKAGACTVGPIPNPWKDELKV